MSAIEQASNEICIKLGVLASVVSVVVGFLVTNTDCYHMGKKRLYLTLSCHVV